MAIRDLFRRTSNVSLEDPSIQLDDALLQALLNNETITRDKAMMLPAVSAAVSLISDTIASMPIRLYRKTADKVSEIKDDPRAAMLNGDTGDTLTGYQLKKALVEDYLLDKGGYAVIERRRNNVAGIYYVEPSHVSIYKNSDPVHKYIAYNINGHLHESFDVLKLLRSSKDGGSGTGLISEVTKAIETAYTTMLFQLDLAKTGGIKKGFLQSNHKLTQDAVNTLKAAWKKMYSSNTESTMVLNDGITFKESSATSQELQLDESKKTLADEINSIFHIEDDFYQTFKKAIYPIMKAFESELNSVLLLENEKRRRFWEFDTASLLKGSVTERYAAYQQAWNSGWKTINEIRADENLNYIEGMDVLNIGLSAVLYDIKEKRFFTPNTGTAVTMKEATPADPEEDPAENEEPEPGESSEEESGSDPEEKPEEEEE